MRNMMFARTFPMTHPRKGEPTWFVEKIWKFLWDTTSFYGIAEYEDRYNQIFTVGDAPEENIHVHAAKGHTIRAGNRWKVGDFFTPRVWSGRPYNSKTIQFAPPIEVKKVWPIAIRQGVLILDTCDHGTFCYRNSDVVKMAKNDGLSPYDFICWFQPKTKPIDFEGQIICWDTRIEY